MFKSVLKTPYAQWAYRAINYTAPLAAGLCGCATRASAGPINNAIAGVSNDVIISAVVLGGALIIWQGARILMDEHHSFNPGRIAGLAAGVLLIFASSSIGNWAATW